MADLEFEYGGKTYLQFNTLLGVIRDELNLGIRNSAVAVSSKLRRILNEFAAEMERRHSTPWKGGTTDRTLSKRSGKGVEAIRKKHTIERY